MSQKEIQILEDEERTVTDHWEAVKGSALDLYKDFQFHKALEKTFAFIAELNRYAELRAPWKLAKSDDVDDLKRLGTTLAFMAEGLRLSSVLLAPVMPTVSNKILKLLSADPVDTFDHHLEWGGSLSGNTFGEKEILFPKNES